MPQIRWMGMIGLAALLLLAQPASTQSPGEVAVRVVKYDGLAEEILKNRGKVVLVDFWGNFCLPCKKSFPHQVALHRAHQKDGLVVISVSVDPLRDPGGNSLEAPVRQAVLQFLQRQSADFSNLILDEPATVQQNRLRITTVPSLYVFDRQGQWTRFDANNLKHDENGRYFEVEALVRQYLKQ